jgi:ABC-2 type transport system ATP-binding protein
MDSDAALLEVRELTKSYGSLRAVDSLSLRIRAGEIFALLGPNGAGKSTAIGMIAGLLRPTGGSIEYRGKPLKDHERGKLGLCPQDICVWESLTCLEQLVLTARLYGVRGPDARRRSSLLLESMGLADKSRKLARTLSGGMKRRLNILLALVHDPEILILDEPQAGLDPQSRILVREYIETLSREKTVILTTHDMEEADKLADRIAIIDHGRLLCMDTPAKVKDATGRGDIVEIQLGKDGASDRREFDRFMRRDFPDASERSGLYSLLSEDASGTMARLLSKLEALGLEPRDYRIRKKNLEDVFIDLTGRGLRE